MLRYLCYVVVVAFVLRRVACVAISAHYMHSHHCYISASEHSAMLSVAHTATHNMRCYVLCAVWGGCVYYNSTATDGFYRCMPLTCDQVISECTSTADPGDQLVTILSPVTDATSVRCIGIRLTGGGNAYEGRVELYHNSVWYPVCDDGWEQPSVYHIPNAKVTCQQLSVPTAYPAAISYSHYGSSGEETLLDNVNCAGSESSLLECPHNGLFVHNCQDTENVGVVCTSGIRLVGGTHDYEGRVEIQYNHIWYPVCDDEWAVTQYDVPNARVVCRELGLPTAYPTALLGSPYGASAQQTILDQVHCTGSESNLFDCTHNPVLDHNCSENEHVGVVCSSVGVRIIGGAHAQEGRVEVYYNDVWYAVCDDYWDGSPRGALNAQVVCRQLGLPYASASPVMASHFGPAVIEDPLIDDVDCAGTESSLFECTHGGLNVEDCTNQEHVGVICA